MQTPSKKENNEHREKVNYHRHLEYLRRLGIDPADAGRAFIHLKRSFPDLHRKQAARIVLRWVEETRSRTLTGKQNLLIRQGLDIILANTILLQRKKDLGSEEQTLLREMNRHIHRVAEILEQAKPQNSKKFLKRILKDLGEIKGILA